MNARARALVAELRALLALHPDACAIGAHAGLWLQVHIVTVDDAAVDAFAAELELGPPARASYEGASWYRAGSSDDDASITVLSRRRDEAPSDEAVARAAGGAAPARERGAGTAKPPGSLR